MTAPSIDILTLDQRLEGGRIPFPEALRYSMMLAEALRRIHDGGRTFGSLQPSNIILTAARLELVPGREACSITPYTAPENLQGRLPDSRSDIFAFGAILYEMITGRRAFAGDHSGALCASLTTSVPPPTGIPAVDHLIDHCIAKDPALRWPRMQKVILELRLLAFSGGSARPAAAAARVETKQLEARVALLLQGHDRAIHHLEQATGGMLGELREQVSNLRLELTAAQEQSARDGQDHGGQVSSLQSELAAVREQLADLRSGFAAAQEQLARDGQDHGGQVSSLQSELAAVREQLAGLKSGFAATQEQLAHAGQGYSEQVSSLQSELAAVREQLARDGQDHGGQVASLQSELAAVREQLSNLRSGFAVAQEQLAHAGQGYGEQASSLQSEVAAVREQLARAEEQRQRILARLEVTEDGIRETDQRITAGEGNLESLNQRFNVLQEHQALRLQDLDRALKSQNAEIGAISVGQVQTDALVEGVVAAMEVLQSAVFDFGGE